MDSAVLNSLITAIVTIATAFMAHYFKLITFKFNKKKQKVTIVDLHNSILYTDATYLLKFKLDNIKFCDDQDKEFIYKTIIKQKIKAVAEISKELISSKYIYLNRNQINTVIITNANNIIKRYNSRIFEIFAERYGSKRGFELFQYVMNNEKVGFNTVFHSATVDYLLFCVEDFCKSNTFDNNIEIIDETLKLYRNAIAIAIIHCEKSVAATNGTIKKILNYQFN